MRLTLRTLLAYRDGVLSPAETSDLHHRIKQTEVASNLLKRIEILVKQKQLLAPKVNGTGLGADANTVAEYLDDSLASDQVPEFERICIAESDLVLAELAHCHQLLAQALHSQVSVPPSVKALAISLTNPQNQAALARRLKIGSANSSAVIEPSGSIRRADDAHAESLTVAAVPQGSGESAAQRSQVQAPMVTSGGGSINAQGLDLERPQLAHEVPEYLAGQRSGGGWRVPLAIAAMAALLGLLAWQALGPLRNVRELFVAGNATLDVPRPEEANEQTTGPASDLGGQSDSQNTAHRDATADTESVEPKSDPSTKTSNVAARVEPTDVAAGNSDIPRQPDAQGELETIQPTDIVDNTFRWTPGHDDLQSVLLVRKTVGAAVSLRRVAANVPIPADVEIVVPPSMRPTLDLAGRCSWTACGPSLMQLAISESVTINTPLCRAMCRPLLKAGPRGRKLTVASPTVTVDVQFDDANSMAAVEVAFRPVSHGPVTDKLAFKPLLIIVAVEGQLTVTPSHQDGVPKNIRLVVGEGVAFMDGQPIEFELGAIPNWYRIGNDRPLDSLAATDMHKLISGVDDVTAQLSAMCLDRRPETAALAIQTQMLLGDWSDFTGNFLNNELMRSHWSSALVLAEQLIASQDQNVEALRTAFEAAHPGRGDALLALTIGASENAPPKEFLPKLVESLGSSKLDERVLATHQLRRLTGKDMGFQPSFPNRAVLQQWRRAIASSPSLLLLDSPLWEAKRFAPNK